MTLLGCSPPGPLPWNVPGKNTGVGCHALLQGIFLTQGSTTCLLCLLYCRLILYHWATGKALFIAYLIHTYCILNPVHWGHKNNSQEIHSLRLSSPLQWWKGWVVQIELIYIYLAAKHLQSLLWYAGSISPMRDWTNPGPLHWECRVSANRPPGKSQSNWTLNNLLEEQGREGTASDSEILVHQPANPVKKENIRRKNFKVPM